MPAGAATPQVISMGGSPYAVVNGLSGVVARRFASRTFAGSALIRSVHAAATSGAGEGTGTGAGPALHPASTIAPSAASRNLGIPRAGPSLVEGSDVDDGTGQRAGDAGDVLHPGDHELAELVDVAGFRPDDHVIRTGDVLGQGDALDLGDLCRDIGSPADLGLDQDVGLDHHVVSPLSRPQLAPADRAGGYCDAARRTLRCPVTVPPKAVSGNPPPTARQFAALEQRRRCCAGRPLLPARMRRSGTWSPRRGIAGEPPRLPLAIWEVC